MKYYYAKYYHKDSPERYSIWKITKDKKSMSCVYDPLQHFPSYYTPKPYENPIGRLIEETISKEEAFLLML